MRIGIMLRAWDEKGGIGVYARNLTRELVALDDRHQYVLFYSNAAHLGQFTGHRNVAERFIRAPNKIIWDQIAIPRASRQERIDVLLHPKFTVPLFAPCKTVMVLHGAGWFMPDFSHFWGDWDLRYVRTMMPVYCRRASAVISVSNITTDRFNEVFRLPADKVRTVYFAPGRRFQRITNPDQLEAVRLKYRLPERFIFTIMSHNRGERKNIGGILSAYQRHHGKTQHHLVIGGKDCDRFRDDFEIPANGYGKDIHFPGWMDQADLPAVYSLADLFLYPSHVEAFPIPITEAMACGTPIITSDSNGPREIAGEAAWFVDPARIEDIASALFQVLSNPELQRSLSEKGLQRAREFSWEKCARETLQILEELVPEG